MDDWQQDGKRQLIEIGEGECKLRVEVYPNPTRFRPHTHQWLVRWSDANVGDGETDAKQDALACVMRMATAVIARARAGEGYTPLFVAQQAYKAYGDHAEWKSWNGLPMPTWAALNDAVRGHWVATCDALIKLLGHGVTALRSDDELEVALKNVGVDLGCAACAAMFYTGVGFPGDEHTCAFSKRPYLPESDMVPITLDGETVGYVRQSAVIGLQQGKGFSIGPMTRDIDIQDGPPVDLGATKPE